ncbi:MAG TPA: DNA/RNA non-specific endonuclease [Dehalococcoidia bacterium]|nr:DNA/RNA non-specific endonuclease [Dehalococcoidia bacterium]
MRATLRILSALVVATGGLPLPAQNPTLEQRVTALERQVAELRARLGITTPTPAAADLPVELLGNVHVRHGFPGGRCTTLVKEFYVICHDPGRKVPEWVTYQVRREDLAVSAVDRTDDFRPDPDLTPGERSELVDYRNSGYDRGHMAPAADFKRSREAMSSTFLLSNMAPQRPNLNRGIWARLEDQVRQVAQSHGRIWVVTGALYLDANGRPAPPPDTIGPNRVAVPSHFYKVILCEHASGAHEMFAFLLPNQLTPVVGQPSGFLVSVDRIEAVAALDFFSALPDDEENRLEALVASSWPIP